MQVNSVLSSDFEKDFQTKNNNQSNPVEDFKKFLYSVDEQIKKSQQLKEEFIEGKDIPLYEISVQAQKAKISLELLVKIRDQAVAAYKEIVNMQI
jgi:flagellar hook-basal body complex protein FliE